MKIMPPPQRVYLVYWLADSENFWIFGMPLFSRYAFTYFHSSFVCEFDAGGCNMSELIWHEMKF